MAVMQLRNLVPGAKFDLDGRRGEVIDKFDGEVKVRIQQEGGGSHVQTMAPGTEVQMNGYVKPPTPQLPAAAPRIAAVTPGPTPAAPTTPQAAKPRVRNPGTDTVKVGKKGKLPRVGDDVKSLQPAKLKARGKVRTTKPAAAKGKVVARPSRTVVPGTDLPVTAFCRLGGHLGFKARDLRTFFDKVGVPIRQNTLVSQVSSGRKGATREEGGFQGDVPKLSKSKMAEFKRLIKSKID